MNRKEQIGFIILLIVVWALLIVVFGAELLQVDASGGLDA